MAAKTCDNTSVLYDDVTHALIDATTYQAKTTMTSSFPVMTSKVAKNSKTVQTFIISNGQMLFHLTITSALFIYCWFWSNSLLVEMDRRISAKCRNDLVQSIQSSPSFHSSSFGQQLPGNLDLMPSSQMDFALVKNTSSIDTEGSEIQLQLNKNSYDQRNENELHISRQQESGSELVRRRRSVDSQSLERASLVGNAKLVASHTIMSEFPTSSSSGDNDESVEVLEPAENETNLLKETDDEEPNWKNRAGNQNTELAETEDDSDQEDGGSQKRYKRNQPGSSNRHHRKSTTITPRLQAADGVVIDGVVGDVTSSYQSTRHADSARVEGSSPNQPKRKKKQTNRNHAALPTPHSSPQSGGRLIHLHISQNVTNDRQYTSPSLMYRGGATPPTDTIYRHWEKASWVPTDSDETFQLNNRTGHVTIKETGVYLVYAQMVYHDLTGRWSFGIYVDSEEKVKCLQTEQLRGVDLHPTSHGVFQQCYTAIPIVVSQIQSVYIKCMYGSRTILTQPQFTFWGIVKLS